MQMYSATVEVARKADKLVNDVVDVVMDKLEPYHPSLSQSQRGWAAATISLPAESLAQATATAAAVVAAAYGADAIAATVMTELERDAREGWAPIPELVGVVEAAEILGVSRQRVLQRIEDGTLPATKPARDWLIARSALQAGDRTSPEYPFRGSS